MKRQIKFRGKRTDTGEWVYGNLLTTSNGYSFIDTNNELYEDGPYLFRDNTDMIRVAVSKVDETTVGQFTGLLDKNGKEIYEGDILNNGQRNYFVCWNSERGAWWLKNKDLIYTQPLGFLSKELFIIGSVHDNPELLEGGKE